ncbi:MAG: hypothetical protein Q8Q09_06355 [Deltaproteobacteria bacterium]|nr:hypothetical protein [Deltaproteobacteria bacterium]
MTTLFVVGGGSLSLHYLFFASIEIACMAIIVRWAVQGSPEGTPSDARMSDPATSPGV